MLYGRVVLWQEALIHKSVKNRCKKGCDGFLEKLERKFGRYAIKFDVSDFVLYSIGFAISLINIEIYYNYLSWIYLKYFRVRWRLITWTNACTGSKYIFQGYNAVFIIISETILKGFREVSDLISTCL